MAKKFTIAIAQLNFTVGDIEGNKNKIIEWRNKAVALEADLIVFSELAITGYPPEDLVLKPAFQRSAIRAIKELAVITNDKKTGILVGGIEAKEGNVFNSAFLLSDGKISTSQAKYDLPNYGVFDEKRVFKAGSLPKPIGYRGIKLGVMICEDMWNLDAARALKTSDILVSINGSPFETDKSKKRIDIAKAAIKVANKPIIYVNQVGGQDELVFDGSSFVLSHDAKLQVKLPEWQEKLYLTSWQKVQNKWICSNSDVARKLEEDETIYQAMVTGLRDYVNKNDFPGVIIGLSGGIDSSLAALLAVDALGKDKVLGFMLPSKFTSKESKEDAEAVAKNLGVKLETISIDPSFTNFKETLKKSFAGKKEDVTEENIQSRIRGTILMALSNKLGHMVLSTGNKSEMSTGFATLYGDLCGGYSVLKDLYKTEVVRITNWRNKNLPQDCLGPKGKLIPDRVFTKPPSAELRPNQKDEDTLPPYKILDDILKKIVEGEMSQEDVIKAGHTKVTVEKVMKMLLQSEYKRRQSPPGVKITAKSFGRDRRYPITNKFSG